MAFELVSYLFKEFRKYPGDGYTHTLKWVNLDIKEYFVEPTTSRHKN